jgi:anti-sigma factor RsiW
MKPCRERERELLSVVIREQSAESSPRLERHLAVCPRCAGALDELRARQARIEAALERLVHAPELRHDSIGEVLRRAREEPARKRRYRAWGFAAAAAVLVLALVRLYPERDVETTSLTTWQSPTAALLRSPAETLLRSTPALGESYGNLTRTLGEQEDGVVP